jgi:hypothetical protein
MSLTADSSFYDTNAEDKMPRSPQLVQLGTEVANSRPAAPERLITGCDSSREPAEAALPHSL